MPELKNIVLLGATGSIGENTLKVIRAHPQRFRLAGIAANRNAGAMEGIRAEFAVPHCSLFSEEGIDGLVRLASLPEADTVIVATTGTVGVLPTIAALEAGKTVGLANKETLVLAGRFVMPAARAAKGRLLPVDSEHNAIFQCLEGAGGAAGLRRVLLTASGGPFLHHTRAELAAVTREEALRHPNWDMGPKVTIDSATMANKGLEMIEAHWLFGLEPQQIEVVIHPQSIIHSMVELRDGSVIAQLAPPSMTFPIQHVLAYPERLEPCAAGLDFSRIHRLELRPPDPDKFPCLRLARQALEAGGLAPAVYNAANEVAVEAFLENELGFLAIADVIAHCLEAASFEEPDSIEALLALEPGLRQFASKQLQAVRARTN
jgi:1-deoxy-D-xylulose-5-phosphate reductoisomerase